MEFITSAQAAEKWGITPTRVTVMAKGGLIPGAVQIGYRWMIPEHAEKPLDGRTKSAKAEKKQDLFFRFPTYEGRDPASVVPPLSKDELQLKRTMEAFYSCRFEEAKQLLADLPERTGNKYLRISALRSSCTISIFLDDRKGFLDSYGKLTEELQGEFPHKREMCELMHELNATLGDVSYFPDGFRIEPDYAYHQSFLPHLGAICAISLFYASGKGLTSETLKAYELLCTTYDERNCYVDSQTIHLYLGCSCALSGMDREMTAHLRRAFSLAETHHLYYGAATLYYYMKKSFDPVLSEFSEEFRSRLQQLSDDTHKRYVRFMDTMSMDSIFKLLLHKEYIYVLYAAQEYQNKEVAKLLHTSERTVSNTYSEIYDMLGVKNKRELVELYRCSINNFPSGKCSGR